MTIYESIQRDTPKVIRRLKQTIIYTIAGSLPFAKIISAKLGMDAVDYAEWAGVVILIAKGVSMLFGVSDDEIVSNAEKAIDDAQKVLTKKSNDDQSNV